MPVQDSWTLGAEPRSTPKVRIPKVQTRNVQTPNVRTPNGQTLIVQTLECPNPKHLNPKWPNPSCLNPRTSKPQTSVPQTSECPNSEGSNPGHSRLNTECPTPNVQSPNVCQSHKSKMAFDFIQLLDCGRNSPSVNQPTAPRTHLLVSFAKEDFVRHSTEYNPLV